MFNIVNKNVLLDNNSTYKIMYSINVNDRIVYYLINVDDFSDIKFCYMVSDDEFEEIRSKDELTKIVENLGRGASTFIKWLLFK